MEFALYRLGVLLFTRANASHWWQTGFQWGVFSHPNQLTMPVKITLKDSTMRTAFTNALLAKGYSCEADGNTVSFTFVSSNTILNPVTQAGNAIWVDLYNQLRNNMGITSNDPNEFTPARAVQTGCMPQYMQLCNILGTWRDVSCLY